MFRLFCEISVDIQTTSRTPQNEHTESEPKKDVYTDVVQCPLSCFCSCFFSSAPHFFSLLWLYLKNLCLFLIGEEDRTGGALGLSLVN